MIRKLVVVLLAGMMCLVGITSALAVKYNEAPMLRVKVAAGELPPVEERLPEEPLVLPVRDKIGTYGGTVDTASFRIPPLLGYNMGNFSGQTLVTYAWGLRAKAGTIVSNIAKDFEVNENATKFTFYLRKGMKWSDGYPFTTEDITFYWNQVIKNDQLTLSKPPVFKNKDGSLMELKVIDETTFQLIFKDPQPAFLSTLASAWGSSPHFVMYPKHYLKKFHPDFTDEKELKTLVKEEGFDEWFQLFGAKVGSHKPQSNPEKPRLQAWIPKKVPPDIPPWVWERNPYFWAVDEEGNQLPYIDRFRNTKVEVELNYLRAITGESDMAFILSFDPLGELKKAEKEGKLKVLLASPPYDTERHLIFNQTSNDPMLRKIFGDKRFRVAVSHAINREQISNLLYFGMLEPQQSMPPKGSEIYEVTKHLAKKYTEYDPEKANRLLDEVGLDKRDSKGYRLRPDGKPLFLNVLTYQQAWAPTIEIFADNLREVGLNTQLKIVDLGYFWPAVRNNEVDVWATAGGPVNPTLIDGNARFFVPFESGSGYAPKYGQWVRTDGKQGEKPTGAFMENVERWRKLLVEPDAEKRLQLKKEIVTTAIENLWVIGTLEANPLILVFNPKMKNVPEGSASLAWDNIFGDVYRPETYFFEE